MKKVKKHLIEEADNLQRIVTDEELKAMIATCDEFDGIYPFRVVKEWEVIKYQPSNGSEGDAFICSFCNQCSKEEFTHTLADDAKQCDILTRTMIHDVNSPDYPTEWQYDQNGQPTCTAYDFHIWMGDDGNIIHPAEPEAEDPNQLDLFKS